MFLRSSPESSVQMVTDVSVDASEIDFYRSLYLMCGKSLTFSSEDEWIFVSVANFISLKQRKMTATYFPDLFVFDAAGSSVLSC